MIRKRIPVVLLILFPVLLYGSSPRIIEINTRHFTIVYPSELTASAIDISCRAEAVISSFVNFMQYEPPGRIILRITAPADTGIDSDRMLPLDSPGTIRVEAVDYPESTLNLSEVLSDRYIKLFKGNFSCVPGISGGMISGLIDYIILGIDDESIVQLNDYVLNRVSEEFGFDEDNDGNYGLHRCMSRFFWDYLVSAHGKDAAAQSLKDAAYFGGFFNSLCRVTGKDRKVILEGFRLFLERYLVPGKPEVYDTVAGLRDLSYIAISHSCDVKGNTYALIAERDGDYYLFSTQGERISFSAIKTVRGDIKPASITVCGDNIVISGYDRYGSVMLCCDSTGREILWEREFPFIYINHVHADKTGLRILFSAEVKGQSSLFMYDMKSVVILKTENDGIDLVYPSFTDSGHILYVRRDNAQSLMLLDAATGSGIEIYRTSNAISGPVEDPMGRILFSESVKGVTDIRCIDRSAGTVEQLTSGSTSNIYPLVMNGRLFFLNYYKGGFRPVFRNSYIK